MKFRKGKMTALSDIQQIFHQKGIQKADQDTLRFTWREYQLKPIKNCVI